MMQSSRGAVCVGLLLAFSSFTIPSSGRQKAQPGARKGEWRYYGGDQGGRKYSPLDQINKDNAKHLKVAWTWDSPDVKMLEANPRTRVYGHEGTPLMIGGALYISTALGHVAALDAQTGQIIWSHDTGSFKAGRPTNNGFLHRGVAYWTDGKQERIFMGTSDAYLIALDAKTGRPIQDFGENGRVNLTRAIPLAAGARNYAVTSPPMIYRDVVIVGSSISDGPTNKEAPRGDVQAFDARTGRPVWIFHTIPKAGELGIETWENESWKYTGAANVWPPMALDEETGYVYLPTGTPRKRT